jgi:hypothetical protein
MQSISFSYIFQFIKATVYNMFGVSSMEILITVRDEYSSKGHIISNKIIWIREVHVLKECGIW